MPFEMTWIAFKGIMPSETRQEKINIVHSHLLVKYQKQKQIKKKANQNRQKIGGCLRWRVGDWKNGSQRHTFPVIR